MTGDASTGGSSHFSAKRTSQNLNKFVVWGLASQRSFYEGPINYKLILLLFSDIFIQDSFKFITILMSDDE